MINGYGRSSHCVSSASVGSSPVRKLFPLETAISTLTVKAAGYIDGIRFTEETFRDRIDKLTPKYPWLNLQIQNDEITDNGKLDVQIIEIEEDLPKEQFMSKVLTQSQSASFSAVFLFQSTRHSKSAISVLTGHVVADAVNAAHFIADFLSDATEFTPQEVPNITELLKQIPDEPQQEVSDENLLRVPPNPSPSLEGPIHFETITMSFPIDPIMKTCKLLNIRPQSILIAAEIYTLVRTIPHSESFNTLNLCAVNTRKAFGLSPTAPFNAPASIYIPNSINAETTVKSVILHSQAELDESLSKFPLIAFKAALNMKNKFVMPTSAISNLGLFDTKFDIWAHGDMRVFPDALRPLRNFVFHGMTSNNHLNLVLTYLVPGCEPEFVTSLRTNIENFLTSLPDIVDNTILP